MAGAPPGDLERFELEEFFAKHEFSAKYLMCCSDAETLKVSELLAMADDECRGLWENLTCGYTESEGLPILRQEIAKDYPGVSHDDIFCFSGAEEGIYATMRSLLTKDDHCIVVTPCYQSLRSVASVVCGSLSTLELKRDEQWKLDIDALQSLFKPNTAMVVMNFPHNPTGALLTPDEQQAVVKLCRDHDVFLFFDEVYRGIELPGVDRLPPIASLYEKGISLGVVSKSLGLAGLRIGWIACRHKATLQTIAGYKHYLSICNSAPSEILALIALRSKDRILKVNADIVARNTKLVEEFLADPRFGRLFSWTAPKAGCCSFMAFHGAEATAETGSKSSEATAWLPIADEFVESASVLTLPGHFFSPAQGDHFRVGLGRRNFPIVLEQFKAAVLAKFGDGSTTGGNGASRDAE